LLARWKRFDARVMKRWFGGKNVDRVYQSTGAAERMLGNSSDGYGESQSTNITSEGLHVGQMPQMALSPIDEAHPHASPLVEESLND
jgi:hypothetical protein